MKEIEYSPWNLFNESCEKYRDNILLIYNDNKFTYGQIYQKVLDFCTIIEGWDFKIGGIYLPNCTEFITSMLGLNRQKKVFVSLSYQFKGDTLTDLINYTDVELLITDPKGYNSIQDGIEKMNIRIVLVLQENGTFEKHEFKKDKRELTDVKEDTFGICFTSGSTSRPKGIVLSNHAIVGNALAVAEHLGFTSDERTILPRSLAQASPISGDVLMAISRGGGIILLNNVFHPAIFLKAVQEYKATNFYIVRTMLLQILEYSQLKNYDISSVKRVLIGGMVNPMTIYRRAAEAFPGARVFNAYGTSEASARVTFGEHEDVTTLPCVIGKPMRGCGVKIYREDGSEAQVGEIGELYITSDYMMDGYYNSPELTTEVLGEKGFRVRDLGYKDEEGRFFVLSRNDDMIMQGGSRAYPIDIEEVMLKNPVIKESAVIGVDDEKLGQKIVAMVVLKEGCHAEVKDIYKWCNIQLEDRKVPKEIYIISEIPRNAIGKISKKDVKELYQSLKK
ncbi:class I adenylate-forming enzyme family protein [Clostridium sp. BNL1100]|uniref:class I adenylate-forming enzyme family protein n=1 Tax=Clostridium sp. BNL1100 TaxID=755731 RepID=UPI00024A7D83|nr:class I adenylate-forming enzyme family protein [Clostridium sp. BNL1100]AEY64962.1 acyl-CoA synthetase (AMP-forming)/AMP-acid ligase II [Clostridium sp. BNL1100]